MAADPAEDPAEKSEALDASQEDVERCLPSWWDRHCQLQHSYGTSILSVRVKALGLQEVDIPSLLLALGAFCARCIDPTVELVFELDASENDLSDEAGALLVDGLHRMGQSRPGQARLRVLKLHKNQVGDVTCERIAALIWHQKQAVEEIHLSHNEVRQKGMAALLAALALHPEQAYPRATPGEEVPCWVRLEHNQVSHPEYLLNLLGQNPTKLRICLAPRRDRGPSCTSFRCQAVENVAHVHLYCIDKQDDAQIETKKHAQDMVQQAVADCHQGRVGGGELSRAIPPEPSGPPADAAECRLVELNVDPDLGAGLYLSEGQYGFVVDDVDEKPGQQLSPGDVVLEIDGVQLWGDLGEERLGEAFGSRFADGARLRVARADAVQGRPLWQPLSIPGASLSSRCEGLRESLDHDLTIMGQQCGVQTKLEDDGAWFRGPPQHQRWAADELPRLLAFYFPEASLPFPSCHWRGDPDETCNSTKPAEPSGEAAEKMLRELRLGQLPPDATFADLAAWEKLLRGQWCEDDNIFDEDLPVEPLEAPDDGPDVFEGQALAPQADVSQPLRVLMLVGLPGSGKSTLAARMQRLGWVVINQDTLGDRRKCVAAANDALSGGQKVIIDRCNVTRLQRRVWLGVADENEASVACMWLDVPEEECGDRVLRRFGHQTLPASDSSLEVISAFQDRMEVPVEAEGFILWHARDDGDVDEAVAEIQELAETSEAQAEAAETGTAGYPREHPQEYPRAAHEPREGFTYKAVQRRGVRALYLRTVRRQIEYYFSDKNLKQDWFFQEKILEAPEPEWLEMRWILSCPRIRDVHRCP
ncbi:pnk1 [Symbiodinium natans]|uniref:Pnk1 protein n=1 Tax=Symbiodinium natans TaxID=878477 RepID=A0A812U3T8_9DINO|nr:pnk1 [Symbiodinium natans]